MAFDKTAWDPTPAQMAGFAVFASWILAWAIEFFIVKEDDVAALLRTLFKGLTGSGPLEPIWTPLLFGVLIPFLALFGVMMADRKNLKFKRIVLGVGLIGLTALWVLADLTMRIV
ncbi:MAG: hypothetical protein KC931_20945 [Candidatus Omnitrophica bacterium]|nr:hypothetical protein [Candidatus Omnitrophota bacterium]